MGCLSLSNEVIGHLAHSAHQGEQAKIGQQALQREGVRDGVGEGGCG